MKPDIIKRYYRNPIRIQTRDSSGCSEGLTRNGVNENKGAESKLFQLGFLLALYNL